ncbi:MAG TPA: asparagine synthase-related protein, partial [Thermoanaerobaculia bacterium]|nr:asparagine synthase-related protein [Thermoanaerobaculia bacterium]
GQDDDPHRELRAVREAPLDPDVGDPGEPLHDHRQRQPGDEPAAAAEGAARRRQAVASPASARAASLEVARANRAGIDMRRPFRDRRLAEFFLALPAHQLYRPGWPKWVLRQAMRGVLPEPVRRRRRPTTLYPLFLRGIEREHEAVRALLGRRDALWPRYVRREWLDRAGPGAAGTGDGIGSVVLWRCLCLEAWRSRVSLAFPGGVSHE